MNIFILDPNPYRAAQMHCDQHIHKMILESAQMLSTAFHKNYPEDAASLKVYKPAYENHPCTVWATKDVSNAYWIVQLCIALEDIRKDHGFRPHKSMEIIRKIEEFIENRFYNIHWKNHTTFALAMPAHIRIRPSLDPVKKYQDYYKFKHRQWLDRGAGMTYKINPVPDFMKEYF